MGVKTDTYSAESTSTEVHTHHTLYVKEGTNVLIQDETNKTVNSRAGNSFISTILSSTLLNTFKFSSRQASFHFIPLEVKLLL